MIEIIFGSVVYYASLINCYDGDTCKIKFKDFPEIVSVQDLRFIDFDTPEINGKCESEKELAILAKNITLEYMSNNPKIYYNGKKGKYGRLLISAPILKDTLIKKDLAKEYSGGKKESWCD